MVPNTTTREWSLLISWKDRSTEWIKLKDIKDSDPIQIAECAFNWWVYSVLKTRNRIIAKVKLYHVKVAWRANDKYTPDSVQHWKAAETIGYQEIRCHILLPVVL